MKTRKNSKQNNNLKNVYGSIILPKGLFMYHTSEAPYIKNENEFLFLTFGVKDWFFSGENYITKFELNKDLEVFFMIRDINNGYSQSLLPTLTGNPQNKNLNKQDESKLICYSKYLIKEKLDGWFCSIEGGSGVEIALYKNDDSLDIIERVKIVENFKKVNNNTKNKLNKSFKLLKNYFNIQNNNTNNDTINNNITNNNINYIIKNHTIIEDEYIPNTDKFPLTLIVNYKYKDIIEDFLVLSKKQNYNYPFQIIFKNAEIYYFKRNGLKNLKWNC